ncbi:MAG: hypothetical protein U5L96_16750 [Owenweeksia sp.]|nr:hypothetical protein [Owenweeksia sp.]
MKNYQPEASLFLQDQAQIFRLAQLSQNNNNLFYEVSAVLPYSVAINKRIDLGITYCNAATEKWLGKSC